MKKKTSSKMYNIKSIEEFKVILPSAANPRAHLKNYHKKYLIWISVCLCGRTAIFGNKYFGNAKVDRKREKNNFWFC